MDIAGLNLEALTRLGKPVVVEGRVGTEEGRWIPTAAARAWTGHSERATLASALASLGVGKDERNPLGRWAPEASDQYVRTYKALVRKLVAQFVGVVRGGSAYKTLDEEDAYLAAHAAADARADPPLDEMVFRGLAVEARGFLRELAGTRGGAGEGKRAEETQEIKEMAADLAEEESDEEGVKYLVSVSQRGTVHRLHRADGCWRAKGRRFAHYHPISEHPPSASSYSSVCKDCWPEEAGKKVAGSSSGSSSSSSSSS